MGTSTTVAKRAAINRTSGAHQLREARLRTGHAGRYPGIVAGVWTTAAVLADQVLASLILRGIDTAVRGRVLLDADFEFRGGCTHGGQREGMRPRREEDTDQCR